MKKTLLLLLLASGLTAYATDPPKFLVGLNYVLKSDLTDKELIQELGADREGLKNWLAENPEKAINTNDDMAI